MKKIFLTMAMAIMAMLSVSAQTFESSRFIDNTYVRVEGGATALTHPRCLGYDNWGHSIQGVIGAEIGKWVTPIFGVAFEGDFGLRNGSKNGKFQWIDGAYPDGYRAHTFNYITVTGLAKANLSNIFGGFKSRTVEFVVATGPMWIHGYPSNVKNGNGFHYYVNDFGVKFKAEVNFNVSKRWQINLIPEFNYNLTGANGSDGEHPKFDSRSSWYGLKAGVTYKIGKQFTVCDKKYTQSEWDALNKEVNDLRARTPETVEKVVEKTVVKTVATSTVPFYEVGFARGSYSLSNNAKGVLDTVPTDVSVSVEATASPDGSKTFNKKLSQKRADAVAQYLKSRGVTVVSANGLGATGADSQRVAKVIVK